MKCSVYTDSQMTYTLLKADEDDREEDCLEVPDDLAEFIFAAQMAGAHAESMVKSLSEGE